MNYALDVRNLISAHNNLFNMVKLMFGKKERQLLRFQRRNVLEFGGTESDTTDSGEEFAKIGGEYDSKQFVNMMTGYTPRDLVDKKLILGIIHRRNHKDIEEDPERIDGLP